MELTGTTWFVCNVYVTIDYPIPGPSSYKNETHDIRQVSSPSFIPFTSFIYHGLVLKLLEQRRNEETTDRHSRNVINPYRKAGVQQAGLTPMGATYYAVWEFSAFISCTTRRAGAQPVPIGHTLRLQLSRREELWLLVAMC